MGEGIDRMKQKLTVVLLGTSDIENSTRFYEKGLGLSVDHKGEEAVFFNLENIKFALINRAYLKKDANVELNEVGFSPCNLCRMVESKKDVNELIEQARKAGAKVTRNPDEAWWGGYSGFFADLDNHLWEIGYHPDWVDR
ncbi:VOC family protein [Chloroflexi bacterium TSY]|nr:VOC family protein [Chloroflexi bacterium TSY]